ncbi:protein-disulfide reductase DsbD [Allopusillimonas soli]|uniref:Thiol:disulfide interchange protein DsbD n=1 Tax=Allopusillimonas soli TaxID=659016 RepID=A0A853FFF9_9BURK|nr:protein-disulfide reductase DsbD [Allopusillimonas soli]TEA74894.1 protein-disulfide reductase DsbD [Allopusillimonas soli]
MRARAWARWLAPLLVFLAAWLHAGTAIAGDDYLDPEDAFVFSAAMQGADELAVHFRIAPDYYMYRKRFAFETQPADANVLGQPVFPQGIVKYDPTFDEDMEVYHDQVTILLPLKPGAATPITVGVTGQGCAEAGLCYPPDTHTLTLTPVAGGYQVSGKGATDHVPPPAPQVDAPAGGAAPAASSGLAGALDMNDAGFAGWLGDAGWLQIMLACLVLGLLLSFTPCVLPMVPILMAILAGSAGAQADAAGEREAAPARTRPTRWRGLSLAAAFVLGMSIVYTALGVAAGLIGASLAAWLQAPWVLTLFALLLAILALAMFGVFTLQAPVGMQSALNSRLSRIPGGHYGGAFAMGMLSALVVGPCVAAPLAGVLLFISQTGDVVLGGSALFALAWGEGLLLLAVGASSGMLLPRAGAWMDGIKALFGMLLLGTAWWMMTSVVPAWLGMLGWALLALWSAVLLGAFGRRGTNDTPADATGAGIWPGLRRAVGLLFALWAGALIVGLALGGRDTLRPLAPLAAGEASRLAAGAGPVATHAFTQVGSTQELDNLLANTARPVMLDFYADWCVSCIEMERYTFSDPEVAQLMSRFVLVRADVTRNAPQDRALLKRFDLFGPPGIIFFDAQGRPLPEARVVGFKNAAQFGAVLSRVLDQAGNQKAS